MILSEARKTDDYMDTLCNSILRKLLNGYHQLKQSVEIKVDIFGLESFVGLYVEDKRGGEIGETMDGFEIKLFMDKEALDTGFLVPGKELPADTPFPANYYSMDWKIKTYAELYYFLMHELQHAKQAKMGYSIDAINRKKNKRVTYKQADKDFDSYVKQPIEVDANMQAALEMMVRKYIARAEFFESKYSIERIYAGLLPDYIRKNYDDGELKKLKKAFLSNIHDERMKARNSQKDEARRPMTFAKFMSNK